MAKGLFSELDPELMKRRLSLQELEKAGLNGESTDIEIILAWMAKCEKLRLSRGRASRGARTHDRHAAAEHDGRRGFHNLLLCIQL